MCIVVSERFPFSLRRKHRKFTAWKSCRRQLRITNAEFFVGKAEEVLPEYYADYAKEHPGEHARADVIVVDPPRKGCERSVLDTMVQMEPERIVYVSCDSATLARDVKYLRENGYEIRKVKATDMFPMSVHVETVVLLSQLKQK